ncbi:MAG: hypothetical protein IT302_10850 [Dehalococcoidia bacterium]|nr:hypothetical protein [Dehalococcoidia bacterium]
MGKYLTLLLGFVLLSTARCYGADLEASLGGLPIVGPMVAPVASQPAYITAIGTPAAAAPPETDLATFFPAEATDPYDVARWTAVRAFLATAHTQAGWTEVCKKAAAAAGADRAASPPLGALACSNDGSVTAMQQFAVKVLEAQASLALYIKGAPGAGQSAVQGLQGEIRVICTTGILGRQGGATSPWGLACAAALDTAYLAGDAPATFAKLGEAYTAAATLLAAADATIDDAPGYFAPEKTG